MKRGVILFALALLVGVTLAAFFTTKTAALSDEPTARPTRLEIVPSGTAATDVVRTSDVERIPELMQPTITVKRATTTLLERTCAQGTDRCKLQAIYDFIRLNYEYVENSPQHTYIQPPVETLYYGSGDAIDLAILLASMQRVAGFENEILVGPYHVFVRTQTAEKTFMADPACQGCQFMDVRVNLRGDEEVYR